jgi:hypothetical protein
VLAKIGFFIIVAGLALNFIPLSGSLALLKDIGIGLFLVGLACQCCGAVKFKGDVPHQKQINLILIFFIIFSLVGAYFSSSKAIKDYMNGTETMVMINCRIERDVGRKHKTTTYKLVGDVGENTHTFVISTLQKDLFENAHSMEIQYYPNTNRIAEYAIVQYDG